MTLNGDILDNVYCENDGELNGTLLDIRFCALSNTSVITHEVRSVGQHIVKREKTGKVTMTCHLSNIEPRNGGIVCTSVGIILILDFNRVIHFINDTGKVVSSMCLKDLKILHAERLFLDKHDRVWIKGKHEDETHDGGVYITDALPISSDIYSPVMCFGIYVDRPVIYTPPSCVSGFTLTDH
jgi:hypothetical protein